MTNYPTQREKNGFQLQRLRSKCEEYHRKKFHDKFPKDPKALYAELKKHDKKFMNFLRRKSSMLNSMIFCSLLHLRQTPESLTAPYYFYCFVLSVAISNLQLDGMMNQMLMTQAKLLT